MSERTTGQEHTLIIDRLVDEETAVVELDGRTMVPVPRALLPATAGPDTVLRVVRDPAMVAITLDPAATAAARRESRRLTERLRARDPGGDLAL